MRGLPAGYDAVRVLGAGGFGEVVLARQVSLDRLVAVKRLHGYALAQPDALERFRREAQVLAAVDHPAVVRVLDFQRDGPDAMLVMEYVDGKPLSTRLADGDLSLTAGLSVLADVAGALQAADAHGVTHRDIKPDNVFVLPNGAAKLGDFGLARIVADPAVFRTTDGSASGTPAYFAPELSQGTGEPDAHSDAYSFAVMAYELLTGRLPFDEPGAIAMIAAHWTQTPPDPEDVAPGFPPAASRALLAGLAKEPTKRPLPHELVAALRAVPEQAWPARPVVRSRSSETVRVAPASAPIALPAASRRGVSRRPLVAGLVLGLLAVAAVLTVAVTHRGASAPPLAIVGAAVTSDPADGSGRCPSASYAFHAVLDTNGGAGSVQLRWTQPDGRLTAPSTVRIATGQKRITALLSFDVTGQRPLTGRAVLHVLSPTPREATSAPIRYTC